MARLMKNSGIQWIGNIPQDWNIRKLKYCILLYTGNSIKDNEKDNYSNNINANPYIATKDIDYPTLNINYENGMYTKCDDKTFKIAPKDSILLCIEGGSAGKKIAYLDRDVSFVNKLCCLNPININSKYLYYYVQSPSFNEEFNNNISGLIGGVSVGKLSNFNISFPPLEEQQRISNYLDEKCSKIDETIEKEKAIIEKLKEYKQSLITETVTKGLNKNVPLKDSGIDWIGSIPQHWKVSKIRYLFTLRDEKNYKSIHEVKLLSLYTELGVFPHGEQVEKGNKAISTEGYKVVYKNDIVVNIILAWQGAIGLSKYNGVTSPAYDVYKPNMKKICPKFYHYLFRTKGFSSECYKYGRGIMLMRWRTYSTEFKNIKVSYPPMEEQKEIAKYLDEKCNAIDNAITQRETLIDKLTEYKKSLIYECVTGKKEV